MTFLANVAAYMIIAAGCQPQLGYCGYVGNHVKPGDITTMRPSDKKDNYTPKSVTWVYSETGYKNHSLLSSGVQCSPCPTGTKKCVDCTKAP